MDALKRLGALPGMTEVKAQVEQLIQFARISAMRKKQGLKAQPQSNHMVFTGNPGTGKTTAARLIGEAFASLGLLKSNSDKMPFVEIHHADITHPHVGQAEQTIKARFKQAKGGVVFIDEAYAFIDGESNHRSDDKVIAAVVQLMEDMRDEIMVIAAGYPEDMEKFLDSNPGLRSRFSNKVHFPDYSVPDLIRIAQVMCSDREYIASPEYLESLSAYLWAEKSSPGFGNARAVRNALEQSIRVHSVRVSQIFQPSREDLSFLRGVDAPVVKINSSLKEDLIRSLRDIQQRLFEIEIKEISTLKER